MAYIGNPPAEAYTNTVKDSFNGDGSTVAFTMSQPSVTNDVRVVVENVIQDPTVAYSCSGTTLTFTSAPPSGTNNIYVVHLGPAVMTTVPPSDIASATTFASDVTVQGAFTSRGIDDNATSTAMTLDSSGNFGIGTSSPSGASGKTLAINGGSGQTRLALKNTSTGDASGDGFQISIGTDGSAGIEQRENNYMAFLTNASEAMRIGSNGDIGIGTTTPMVKLHIHDSTSARFALTNSSTGQTFPDGFELLATNLDAYVQNRSNGNMIFTTNNAERCRIDSSGAVTMPSQPAFLATKSAKQSNVAVNSQVTVVFETEVFDQNNDFASSQFTAPVTGKYQLNLSLYTNELDSAADYYIAAIKTSNREYQNVIDPGVLASDPVYWNQGVSVLADMDANDTAYVFIQQGNGNQQADVATPTLFSGYLVA